MFSQDADGLRKVCSVLIYTVQVHQGYMQGLSATIILSSLTLVYCINELLSNWISNDDWATWLSSANQISVGISQS